MSLTLLLSCGEKEETDKSVSVKNDTDTGSEAEAVYSEEISFNDHVMPILSDKCFHCHGPDAKNQTSEYRLDTEENAKKALESGKYGILAGDLEGSLVHKSIHSTGEDMMPPANSNRVLSDKEKQTLDTWIKQGAKYTKHWSYISVPKKVAVPEDKADTKWAKNEIDLFVQSHFEKHQLTPAKEISKEKWLRRVTFDLTGLPPTIAELDAFLADESDNAYEKIVDGLFKTDTYAERMTNEWMDVARYADSYGYQLDKARFVWPWRDWVLKSFKENQKYSEFLTWQLAGDLLPDATDEQILATTFNRLHSQKVEGGSVEEEFRVEYVSDRLHTFGTAFLGLTMECSRCHDHKYDPISAKNYYEMSSFFANIPESGLYSFYNPGAVPPPTLLLTSDAEKRDIADKLKILRDTEKALSKKQGAERALFEQWLNTRPAVPAWKGKLAHMTFEEPIIGGNKQVEGKKGKAIQLSGDHGVTVEGVGFYDRDQPISISFWIQPTSLLERGVVFKQSRAWTDIASKGYELLIEDGKLSAAWINFWPGNAIRIKSAEPLPVNKWTQVTVSYDGSSSANGLKLYINGKLDSSEVVRDSLTREIIKGTDKKNQHLILGERDRDSGFKQGQLDELQVFDRTISAVEAKQLWDGKSLITLLSKEPGTLNSPEKEALFQYYLRNHSEANTAAMKTLRDARVSYYTAMDKTREIMVMEELEKPKKAFILDRGLYSEIGEEVKANTPEFLPPFPENLKKDRLGLTKWLLEDNQPLTSRVTVNRYWQMIFSRGIVSSPEDFGSQGTRPTHSELLDYLARDFMDNGWDVQLLLKQMVLSATYRQSTETTKELRNKDPKNLYLSRGNPARLTAEMIRDQALYTSGLLNMKVGGSSVRPYELAYSLKPQKPDLKNGLYRRSLYTWWQITAPAPVMTTFDASKRAVCRVSRDVTASPLQALVLLNGEQFVEASRALGLKILEEFPNPEQEVELVEATFRTLTSRKPETQELEIFLELYQDQLAYYKKQPKEALELLSVGNAAKSETVDDAHQAAAAILANTIMNLDECLLKR